MCTNPQSGPAFTNPFAAPKAEIGLFPLDPTTCDATAAVLVRLHERRERSIRSLGSLGYVAGTVLATVGAVTVAFVLIAGLDTTSSTGFASDGTKWEAILGAGMLEGLAGGSIVIVSRGLRRLRPWARFVAALFLTGIFALTTAIGVGVLIAGGFWQGTAIAAVMMLIPGFPLHLLLSTEGQVVFSPVYREAKRRVAAGGPADGVPATIRKPSRRRSAYWVLALLIFLTVLSLLVVAMVMG